MKENIVKKINKSGYILVVVIMIVFVAMVYYKEKRKNAEDLKNIFISASGDSGIVSYRIYNYFLAHQINDTKRANGIYLLIEIDINNNTDHEISTPSVYLIDNKGNEYFNYHLCLNNELLEKNKIGSSDHVSGYVVFDVKDIFDCSYKVRFKYSEGTEDIILRNI